jgi:hypothetical protein
MFKLPATLNELATLISLWCIHLAVYAVCDLVSHILERNIVFVGRARWQDVTWLKYLLKPPYLSPKTDLLYGAFVIPFVEDILFFGLPALIEPILAITVSPILFTLIHVLPYVDAAEKAGYYVLKKRIFIANFIAYYPPALISGILWALGYGYASIINHMIVNTRVELRRLRELREREKLIRELARRDRISPFVEEFV